MKKIMPILIVGLFLFACEKEEQKLAGKYLPDRVGQVDMVSGNGIDYLKQVYFDLSTNSFQAVNNRDEWDLALSCTPNHPNLFVNSALLMRVAPTGNFDINQTFNPNAYTADLSYENASRYFHTGLLKDDFNSDLSTKGEVYLIDLGLDLQNKARGYKMLQITSFDGSAYQLKISNPDQSEFQELTIQIDEAYNNLYLSFSDLNKVLLLEPPKTDWDLLFTKYMEKLHDGNDSIDYSVTGCLTNPYQTKGYLDDKSLKDTTISYYSLTQADMDLSKLSNQSNAIGYDWKFFDLNGSGRFVIRPHKHYFIQDNKQTNYRLRFTGFYDESGNKGAVSFEFLEL